MSKAVIQAPRRGEIPRVQIADLCEGCISLSNAEGFGERSQMPRALENGHSTFRTSLGFSKFLP